MPLNLITGKPGTGKSLWTLQHVEKLRQATGRAVYYYGIPELTLPWQPLSDPQKWHECEPGAIIVVDEAQKHWRVRAQGAPVPVAVQEIETHRHKGFDLFFITQDAMLMDQNVRRFVDVHVYFKRIYGTAAATRYWWNQRVARVESKSEYHDALSEKFLYPKKVYGWYKSADVHTVKSAVPYKRIAMVIGLGGGFVAVILWAGWHFRGGRASASVDDATGGDRKPVQVYSGSPRVNPWDLSMRSPRVPELAESAPLYDELQVVRSQPRVSGCMSLTYGDGRVECRCSTSQGSVLRGLSVRQCLDMIRDGWFDATLPEVSAKAENVARLEARDHASAMQSSPGQTSAGMDAGS